MNLRGSYFVRYEYTQQFFNGAFNVWYVYTRFYLFFLDVCGLCLLLQLRQAVIVSNSLKYFTNNAFLITSEMFPFKMTR